MNARRLGADSFAVKQFNDEAGLLKRERETLDRDTDYKRDENDIFDITKRRRGCSGVK